MTLSTTTTLALTSDELRILRLALANWDGWDNNLRTTVPSTDEDIAVSLARRLRGQAA